MIEETLRNLKLVDSTILAIQDRMNSLTTMHSPSDLSRVPGGGACHDPVAAQYAFKDYLNRKLAGVRAERSVLQEQADAELDRIEDPKTREIIWHRFYHCLPWADVAARMHMNTSTARSRWRRFYEQRELAMA